MAKKKPYNVAERFTEVAKRATELNTGPSKTKIRIEGQVKPKMSDEDLNAFLTRPGRRPGGTKLHPDGSVTSEPDIKGKDVNLPLDTAPSTRKKKR